MSEEHNKLSKRRNWRWSLFLMSLRTRFRSLFLSVIPYWSIGILSGESPFRLSTPENIRNPVLTAENIKDIKADFVADPFMILDNNVFYMFFEIMYSSLKKTGIGLAISTDGFNWNYDKVVLSEPFVLSYPFVFKWANTYYLLPETCSTNSIRLYEAVRFPAEWKYKKSIISGKAFRDSTICRYKDKWWLFSSTNNGNLYLYIADDLVGPWIEHPRNPIRDNSPHDSRPAGGILDINNRLFRFAQDDEPTYGKKVKVFEIQSLTLNEYKESECDFSPILNKSGRGWNKHGMHTINYLKLSESKWIACVDGHRKIRRLNPLFSRIFISRKR